MATSDRRHGIPDLQHFPLENRLQHVGPTCCNHGTLCFLLVSGSAYPGFATCFGQMLADLGILLENLGPFAWVTRLALEGH